MGLGLIGKGNKPLPSIIFILPLSLFYSELNFSVLSFRLRFITPLRQRRYSQEISVCAHV